MRCAIWFMMMARWVGLVCPQAVARRVRRIQRPLNVLRVGARNLAECLSRDRGDVLKVLAGSGLYPLAANVVAITRAKAHRLAELARMQCCPAVAIIVLREKYRARAGAGDAAQESYTRGWTVVQV